MADLFAWTHARLMAEYRRARGGERTAAWRRLRAWTAMLLRA